MIDMNPGFYSKKSQNYIKDIDILLRSTLWGGSDGRVLSFVVAPLQKTFSNDHKKAIYPLGMLKALNGMYTISAGAECRTAQIMPGCAIIMDCHWIMSKGPNVEGLNVATPYSWTFLGLPNRKVLVLVKVYVFRYISELLRSFFADLILGPEILYLLFKMHN